MTRETQDMNQKDEVALLKIQNTRKPDQSMFLYWDRTNRFFHTEGLKDLFGVKEVRIDSLNVLGSLEEYAGILTFLLESMSTAKDLSLPYAYQNEFEFEGKKYTLMAEGDYRVLRPVQ